MLCGAVVEKRAPPLLLCSVAPVAFNSAAETTCTRAPFAYCTRLPLHCTLSFSNGSLGCLIGCPCVLFRMSHVSLIPSLCRLLLLCSPRVRLCWGLVGV